MSIPAMLNKKNDDGARIAGSIVNIASVNGIRGGSPDIFYPTTKGAIVNTSHDRTSWS
jgi:NAD(P)-dependent dehydrogenase (short-subunit alcohol dehydrogenase family)